MTQHLFALLGRSLQHSFSPTYYNSYFSYHNLKNHHYQTIEMDQISDLDKIITLHPELDGFNVTSPFKEDIIPFLDTISPKAKEIGAVNVVKVTREAGSYTLHGYNTDYKGFEALLKQISKKSLMENQAIILGSGGASKCVQYVLNKKGIPFIVISRTAKKGCYSYEQLTREIIQQHKIIINCTPLGIYPNIEEKPLIDYDGIGYHHILIDLIYNPEETQFMKEGLMRSSQILNGMKMFLVQAEQTLKILL